MSARRGAVRELRLYAISVLLNWIVDLCPKEKECRWLFIDAMNMAESLKCADGSTPQKRWTCE